MYIKEWPWLRRWSRVRLALELHQLQVDGYIFENENENENEYENDKENENHASEEWGKRIPLVFNPYVMKIFKYFEPYSLFNGYILNPIVFLTAIFWTL